MVTSLIVLCHCMNAISLSLLAVCHSKDGHNHRTATAVVCIGECQQIFSLDVIQIRV